MMRCVSSGIDWDAAAAGWGRQADALRDFAMPVSVWMIDAAALHPGARVLELAAGPGDTGFLAAELIRPGGTLICSDGSAAMLEVARSRAERQAVANVEFKELLLEWIDLPTASVDVILCRWGLMLIDDPAAAAQECRRVLAPGGRLAVAVWDRPQLNSWATIPTDALVDLGLAPAPDRNAPGMFALADPAALDELLAGAGFVERRIEPVGIERAYTSVDAWISEMLDCSGGFRRAWDGLDDGQRRRLTAEMSDRLKPFGTAGGGLVLPGSSLAAQAV
jgi:SAM-dependent methyltransferase